MNLKKLNGDGVAKTDARFNDIVGSFPNDAAEGQLSSSRKISCPGVKELAEQFHSSENFWKNKVDEMAATPWAEISEDPANNSFPKFNVFYSLVVSARGFKDFMSYLHECAPSIDCRNLFQVAMLLRFIFLLAHDGLVEALPDGCCQSDISLLNLRQRLIDSESDISKIILAYAYASMMMPAWVSPDSYFKND